MENQLLPSRTQKEGDDCMQGQYKEGVSHSGNDGGNCSNNNYGGEKGQGIHIRNKIFESSHTANTGYKEKNVGQLGCQLDGGIETTMLGTIAGEKPPPSEQGFELLVQEHPGWEQASDTGNSVGNSIAITATVNDVCTPRIYDDSDCDQSSDKDLFDWITIYRIGWMPAYDIAYVKRLEYDRALQISRDVRNEEIVKHCRFQMESNCNYHLGILQMNKANERRIGHLSRDLERERSINIRLQRENEKLCKKWINLEIVVASKDHELMVARPTGKAPKMDSTSLPSFKIL